MKEKDLKKLGFTKEEISAEESGDKPYYFYSLHFFERYDGLALLSNSDDETKDGDWSVIFLDENRVRIRDRKELETLIGIIRKNSYIEEDTNED